MLFFGLIFMSFSSSVFAVHQLKLGRCPLWSLLMTTWLAREKNGRVLTNNKTTCLKFTCTLKIRLGKVKLSGEWEHPVMAGLCPTVPVAVVNLIRPDVHPESIDLPRGTITEFMLWRRTNGGGSWWWGEWRMDIRAVGLIMPTECFWCPCHFTWYISTLVSP